MTRKHERPGLAGTKGAVDGNMSYCHSTAPICPDQAQAPIVSSLLWGWPQVLAAVGIPRRTLERELAAGRFVRPVLRIGRRPYWSPGHVRRWAAGEQA
jgi:hypothetical protein